jgi:hypothetical protein
MLLSMDLITDVVASHAHLMSTVHGQAVDLLECFRLDSAMLAFFVTSDTTVSGMVWMGNSAPYTYLLYPACLIFLLLLCRHIDKHGLQPGSQPPPCEPVFCYSFCWHHTEAACHKQQRC